MAKGTEIKVRGSKQLGPQDIIQDNNPLIREVSLDAHFPLNKEEDKVMKKMIDYVQASQNEDEAAKRGIRAAYGISGIQAGLKKKIMYVRIENEYGGVEEFALVNPKIVSTSKELGFLTTGEGCLSVSKDHQGYVYRPYQIKLVAIDYFSEREVEIDARGLTAIVLQHEMDHLSGVLFYDRINRLDPFYTVKRAIPIK